VTKPLAQPSGDVGFRGSTQPTDLYIIKSLSLIEIAGVYRVVNPRRQPILRPSLADVFTVRYSDNVTAPNNLLGGRLAQVNRKQTRIKLKLS
jgi:hypothetical protein